MIFIVIFIRFKLSKFFAFLMIYELINQGRIDLS